MVLIATVVSATPMIIMNDDEDNDADVCEYDDDEYASFEKDVMFDNHTSHDHDDDDGIGDGDDDL